MSWYRIYGDTGATFDIWDYGHEIEEVPTTQLYQYIGLFDPSGKKKGYVSGIIYDDISYNGTDTDPIVLPDGTKAPAKQIILSQVFTESAQQQIKIYHRTAVRQPKLFMVNIPDRKNGVVYQIYTASRIEAEGIKNAFNAYGIDNIAFVRRGMNIGGKYISLMAQLTAIVIMVVAICLATATVAYCMSKIASSYYHAKEVISYYEVEKKIIDEKIENLKLMGRVLEFKSLAGTDETETSYIYRYNDGTIVEVDKKTGKATVVRGSNMTDEDWRNFWDNVDKSNKTPNVKPPPNPYTDILKWIAVIAGITGASLIAYKYVSSGKASEHASKAKEIINTYLEKLEREGISKSST